MSEPLHVVACTVTDPGGTTWTRTDSVVHLLAHIAAAVADDTDPVFLASTVRHYASALDLLTEANGLLLGDGTATP